MHDFFGHCFPGNCYANGKHRAFLTSCKSSARTMEEQCKKNSEKTLLSTLAEDKLCHWNIANISLTFLFSYAGEDFFL